MEVTKVIGGNDMKTFGIILMILLIVGFTILAIYMTYKIIDEIKDIRYFKKTGQHRPKKEKKNKKVDNIADE